MSVAVPPNDSRVHVFAVSDGGDPIPVQTYLTGPAEDVVPLQAALGAQVDAHHVEAFQLADIAPLMLRDYLAQAHDVPRDAMAGDAVKLDSLSGMVVVVAPRALLGLDALAPAKHLTHVGAYGAPVPDDTPGALPKATMQAPDAVPQPITEPEPGSRTILYVVIGALVAAALLFLVL